MAEPRRKPIETNVVPLGPAPRPRPRAADGSESPGAAPVQAQLEALSTAFADEAAPRLRSRPSSDLWRMVAIVGAAVGLWATVHAGAAQLLAN